MKLPLAFVYRLVRRHPLRLALLLTLAAHAGLLALPGLRAPWSAPDVQPLQVVTVAARAEAAGPRPAAHARTASARHPGAPQRPPLSGTWANNQVTGSRPQPALPPATASDAMEAPTINTGLPTAAQTSSATPPTPAAPNVNISSGLTPNVNMGSGVKPNVNISSGLTPNVNMGSGVTPLGTNKDTSAADGPAGTAGAGSATDPVLASGEKFTPASYGAAWLDNAPPPYPEGERQLGISGSPVLRVRVSTEGLPLEVELKQSSGAPGLDRAARKAVRRWRFVPARRGNQAVEDWVIITVHFKK